MMATIHSTEKPKQNLVKLETGFRSGRLVVMRHINKQDKAGYWLVRCKCDCGASIQAPASSIKRGVLLSCGCAKKLAVKKRLEQSERITITCEANCPPLPSAIDIEVRHCPDHLGYCVSNTGTLWSCRPRAWNTTTLHWRILKPGILNDGHRTASLCNGQSVHQRLISNLVAEAFIGPKPPSCEVCHNNGIPDDDHVSNLRWDTHKNNMGDTLAHGTRYRPKLTEEDVVYIKRMSPEKTQRKLAAMFGVSQALIWQILHNKQWTST